MTRGSAHPDRAVAVNGDTLSILRQRLSQAGARRVLDLGCGTGDLAVRLLAEGFAVTGLDPNPASIATARRRAPGGRFLAAGAENLPADLEPFDAAIVLNALHHVPVPLMGCALRAALGAVGTEGEVIVVEPLAEGSFFEAMRPIDDESAIRSEAIAALETLVDEGGASLRRLVRWERRSRFADVEGFATDLLRVDPERESILRQRRSDLNEAFDRNAAPDGNGGWCLIQPLVCWVLAPGEPGRT